MKNEKIKVAKKLFLKSQIFFLYLGSILYSMIKVNKNFFLYFIFFDNGLDFILNRS